MRPLAAPSRCARLPLGRARLRRGWIPALPAGRAREAPRARGNRLHAATYKSRSAEEVSLAPEGVDAKRWPWATSLGAADSPNAAL
uniref:Predicted protein n=1 Tax=Hordeum vulgare subsp. vulgare TaxID=112509 RepID=F2D392_HORVV|nr:predicted protein [Hordeum vulgare subsp. vulgare]